MVQADAAGGGRVHEPAVRPAAERGASAGVQRACEPADTGEPAVVAAPAAVQAAPAAASVWRRGGERCAVHRASTRAARGAQAAHRCAAVHRQAR